MKTLCKHRADEGEKNWMRGEKSERVVAQCPVPPIIVRGGY